MERLRTLGARLHDQSVWQVLVSYVLGSWLILQITETMSSLVGLPLWMGQGVVFVLLMGVPVLFAIAIAKSLPSAVMPEEGGSWRDRLTWRAAGLGGVIAFGLLGVGTVGYLGTRALGIGPAATLVAQGTFDPNDRILLADFENATADPSLTVLVAEVLRVDLQQSPAVVLVEPSEVSGALARMRVEASDGLTEQRAREVAQREGIKAVLAGTIAGSGGDVIVTARLVDPRSGTSLTSHRETSRRGGVIGAVDRLSAAIRERIGESLRTIQSNPPLANVTTASLPALEKYARAIRANDNGEGERAVRLLEEVVAEDSLFAMAYRKLGIILWNASLEPERASEALTRAYELRDRLTQRERYLAEAAYETYLTGDVDAANATYQALLELYPTDPTALNNLGVNYLGAGRLEDAEELFGRLVAMGGAPSVAYTSAVLTQFRLGRTQEALSTMDAFEAAFPGHPGIGRTRAALAGALFDFAEAERVAIASAPDISASPTERAAHYFTRSALAAVQGRFAEGERLLAEGYDMQQAAGFDLGMPNLDLFQLVARAEVEAWTTGEHRAPLARLEREMVARELDALPWQERVDPAQAMLYARVGQVERAREILERYTSESDPSVTVSGPAAPSLDVAEGLIAVAEGRFDEGIAQLIASREAQPNCDLCTLPELGDAHRQAGQLAEAAAYYQQYLDTPALYRVQIDASYLWRVLFALGETYEALGSDRAIETYQRFIGLWEGADASVQNKVDEARSAVERLQAGTSNE